MWGLDPTIVDSHVLRLEMEIQLVLYLTTPSVLPQ